MITLKTCTICQLEYDSVLQHCPHCLCIASSHYDQLKINFENNQESIDKNLAREKSSKECSPLPLRKKKNDSGDFL